MDYKTKTLSNGLNVLLVKDTKCPSVTVMAMIKAGARFEDGYQAGIAHLIEHNLFKGTINRPTSKQLSYDVENLGAYQNAYTGKEVTSYYIKGPKKNAVKMFEILTDMLQNSIFPEKEFEKEKKVIIEEIKMNEDEPQSKVYKLHLKELFKGNQLAQDITGTIESVNNIKIAECRDFIENHYSPNNMLIIVSGNFKEELIMQAIEKNYASIKSKKVIAPSKFSPYKLKSKIYRFKKDIEQTHIIIGGFAPGSKVSHKDMITFRLGIVLMAGGMGSRLNQRIREDLGLAYYVDMGYQSYQELGHYYIGMGVDHNKVQEAVNAVLKEIASFENGDVSDFEFTRAKNYIIGSMMTAFETSRDLASWYGGQLLKGQKLISGEDIIKIINELTKQDVINIWKTWVNRENLQITTYGKYDSDIVLENL